MSKGFAFASLLFFFSSLLPANNLLSQTPKINNNSQARQVTFANKKIKVVLDYNRRANISSLIVNGQQVVSGDSGVYSMISTKDKTYSTLHLNQMPVASISGNTIEIKNIVYGDADNSIRETWTFVVTEKDIRWNLDRACSKSLVAENQGFPLFTFSSITTWEGAYQDYGGLAWFYLFNKPLDTYGVHSKSSMFWNTATGNGLSISADSRGNEVAAEYRRTPSNKLAYSVAVAVNAFIPRFDSGVNRRRYIRDTTVSVWQPVSFSTAKTSQSITLSYFNFEEQYGRGKMVGINQQQVSAVLNTIARIGVIDKQHFGGNSWHTPYGPICLHEQYIAQMGLAINDPAYLSGYRDCLDFYCKNAIKPDGRVWPRWAYSNEDAMPGQLTSNGFYEAQWGYLMDSNSDLVTNVAELYDQTGDLAWVKNHQSACELALDWLIARDRNGNGLVEMMTDSTGQKRGSDWIDIIWAAHENAFVNAKLYRALVLWAAIENRLGNKNKSDYYSAYAQKLKTSFNKSTDDGGFWDEDNKTYIHWRDKDRSLHGRNVVTPVSFMAIAYGICDDESRKKLILDTIETQMQKEKLFFWPLCLYSYAPGEGNDWQFPFPNYENGDLFLSWGSLGVKAYASYRPDLALKYVKNVLGQYAKDGLAFQRYGRVRQDGLGDDILAGNSLSVVGLYQSIYGINPLYNRFFLDPHLAPELSGTRLTYRFRGKKLAIGLDTGRYSISDGRFSIASKTSFGFYSAGDTLSFFSGDKEQVSLSTVDTRGSDLSLEIKKWDSGECSWTQTVRSVSSLKINSSLAHLEKNTAYNVIINGKQVQQLRTDDNGKLRFDHVYAGKSNEIAVKKE